MNRWQRCASAAILALTANMAMDKKTRIPFEPDWFDADAAGVPETEFGRK